jgi:large subunit ribosomal protein L2
MEYDPNRTAFIALIKYEDGEQSYILAPQRLAGRQGDVAGDKAVDVKPGNAMPLQSRMPVGTIIHNIEMKPARAVRSHVRPAPMPSWSAATRAWRSLRLNSGEQRLVQGHAWQPLARCRTPTTSTSTTARQAVPAGWASARVRGVAMNPIDHPHGGGEGRTSGGRHPVTPWGKPTKGKRTRSNKSTDKFIIRSRHQRKK